MDITIGFVDNPRELNISGVEGGQELATSISGRLASGDGVLELVDGAGKTYFAQISKIAYVQVGPAAPRQVGFIA
ncbi:DUF3107 domain-containing protein [Corynebacterium sp. NPDC060344]|uniref:DUF3107 domain-containing protein n=1 Tax=Corynebacterium sp. NPDC060344 TaxID=3347101 RepID=UPI003646AB5D